MLALTRGSLRATLIDLDGTLLETAPDLAYAANRVRAEFGLPDLPVERIAQFIGKGTDVLLHRSLTNDLEGRVAEEKFVPAKALFERQYRDVNGSRSRVFDRVPLALSLLREAGLRVGCVTNKPREFTMTLLERTGLLPGLDAVLAGDDVARRKPHPDLLLAACTQLRVAPAATLLIGDSENDVQAAQAAGCASLLVETGYNEGEPVQTLADEPGVGGVFPTLFDAVQWVLQSGLPQQRAPIHS